MDKDKQLAHRRHDISDHEREVLEPLLPGRAGSWGGIARDNRLFINAVFSILRTGASADGGTKAFGTNYLKP